MYLQFENLLLLKIVLFKSGVDEYKNLSFKVKKISSPYKIGFKYKQLNIIIII